MLYTYHFLTLCDAKAETAVAFNAYIAETARAKARESGGEVLGLFAPQLGFASHERAVLFRWRGEAGDPLGACPQIHAVTTDRLNATARPGDGDQVKTGGIVVHRWFTIAPKDKDEFVSLSTAAWGDFESDFDSEVFGLFAVEPTAEDGAAIRMLLVTRYGSHADWEVSRRPSETSAANFRRRHGLTKVTRACSTVLARLG